MQIEFLYPPPPVGHQLNYMAETWDPKPAVRRSGFQELLRDGRGLKRPWWIVATAPEVFGATVAHFREAQRAVAAAGGEIRVLADLEGDRIRAMFDDPRMQTVLSGWPDGVALRVGPVSAAPVGHDHALRHHAVLVYPDAVGVLLLRGADETDVAHELTHIPMAREGYPLFVSGEDASGLANSLLDLEVDRRTAAAGFDPVATTDRHLTARATQSLLRLEPVDALAQYIMRALYPTRLPELRDQYLERFTQLLPRVAACGAEIVVAATDGEPLRQAGTATELFHAAAEILSRHGFGDYSVRTPGWRRFDADAPAMAPTPSQLEAEPGLPAGLGTSDDA